jgi:hypothetical protein
VPGDPFNGCECVISGLQFRLKTTAAQGKQPKDPAMHRLLAVRQPCLVKTRDRANVGVTKLLETLAGLGIDYPFDQAWQQFQIAVVAQIALPLTAMMSWDTLNPRGKELLQVLMERCFQIVADSDAVSAVRALQATD